MSWTRTLVRLQVQVGSEEVLTLQLLLGPLPSTKEHSSLEVREILAMPRIKFSERARAYTHVLSDTPEEDAGKKIIEWAEAKGLHKERVKPRLFGRNTYPTDNPEPHGYEFYLTVSPNIEPEGDIEITEIDGGLCAVLRFKNLEKMREAWQHLWDWIEESEYEHVGWKKGKHGWVNGFEEHLNWHEQKPQNEWLFDLWVQLRE